MAHWIEENERDRKTFWVTAKNAGLDNDGVHELFGVESMKEYTGTPAEALVVVKDYEKRHRAAAFAAECEHLPEAPAVVWTKFQSERGFVWSLTFRAGLTLESEREALSQLRRQVELFEAGAEMLNWLPVANGHDVTAMPAQPQQQPAQPGQPPLPGGGAPPAPQGGNGGGTEKSGTAPLNKITVDADGRVEFHVGSFRWPFKDGRGGEVVADLFDAELGWQPEHFHAGAKYEGDAVAGLVVDWQKPSKWYDVVRVHRQGIASATAVPPPPPDDEDEIPY